MTNKISIIGTLLTITIFSCTQKDNNIRYDYYTNNKIKFIKRYKNNLLDGQSQWFYENGTVEQTVLFNVGKEFGNAYYFYQDGTLKNARNWRYGKMIGYATDYYDDTLGIIKSILLFNSDGNLIYKKNFDHSGHLISEEGKKPEIH